MTYVRRFISTYEDEFNFLETFQKELTTLENILKEEKGKKIHEETFLEFENLRAQLRKKSVVLFDQEYYMERLDALTLLQRRIRLIVFRRRFRRWVLSSENEAGFRRYMVQQDLIQAEISYERQLSSVCSQFLTTFLTKGREEGIGPDDIRIIFSNIEAILLCSRRFIKRILCLPSEDDEEPLPSKIDPRSAQLPPNICIGQIMIDLQPYLCVYSDYIRNIDRSREKVIQLKSSNPKFWNHVKAIEKSLRSSLGKLLSLPVHHLSRYNVMLAELVKFTPAEHIDKPSLRSALDFALKLTGEVQESKSDEEQMERFNHLSKNLDCPKNINLFLPHRRLLHEGMLYKCKTNEANIFDGPGRSSFRKSLALRLLPKDEKEKDDGDVFEPTEKDPFYFILFNDILVVAEERIAPFGPKYRFVNFLGNFGCLEVDIRSDLDQSAEKAKKKESLHYFELKYPDANILLGARNAQEKSLWVAHLKQAALMSKSLSLLSQFDGRNDLLERTVCRGPLLKRGNYLKVWNEWTERVLVLKGRTLFVYYREDEPFRYQINMEEYRVTAVEEEETTQLFSFKLAPKIEIGLRPIYLAAKDRHDFRKWMSAFIDGQFQVDPSILEVLRNYETRKAPRSDDLDLSNPLSSKNPLSSPPSSPPSSNPISFITSTSSSFPGLTSSTPPSFLEDLEKLISVEFETDDEEEGEEKEEEKEEDQPVAPSQVAWIRQTMYSPVSGERRSNLSPGSRPRSPPTLHVQSVVIGRASPH